MSIWKSIKELLGIRESYTNEQLVGFNENIDPHTVLPYSEEDHIKQLEWRRDNWNLSYVQIAIIETNIHRLLMDIRFRKRRAEAAEAGVKPETYMAQKSSSSSPTARPSGNLPTKHETKTDRGFVETVTVYDTSPTYTSYSSSSSSRSCSYDGGSSSSSSSSYDSGSSSSSSSSSGCD